MGKGHSLYTHPLALWAVGLQQRDYISCGFDNTDLVIAINLIEYSRKVESRWEIPIIHIGITPAEIDSSYIPMVEVVGIFRFPQ